MEKWHYVTIFLSRAIEGMVFEQVSRNDHLDPSHLGFKSGHSTETTLLSVTGALRAARAQQA